MFLEIQGHPKTRTSPSENAGFLFFYVHADSLTSSIFGGTLGDMPLKTKTGCPKNAETGHATD
jgi:hypothetical protein